MPKRFDSEFATCVTECLIPHLSNLEAETEEDRLYEEERAGRKWRVRSHWFPAHTHVVPEGEEKKPLLEIRATSTDEKGRVKTAYLYRPGTGNDTHRLFNGWRIQFV